MPTKKQLNASMLYAGLMEEIKIRIAAIDAGTLGNLDLPPPIVREHCFLQIRFLCELVALGCLVAHGDLKGAQAGKIRKQWAADKIMEELTALHPDFYPVPVQHEPKDSGITNLKRVTSPFPKDALIKLYGKCGDVLHRGSLKKLLSQKPTQIDYSEITALTQKFVDLLSSHHVVMLGGDMMFICNLRKSDTGNVQVAIAEKETPLVPPRPAGARGQKEQ